MGEKGRQNRPCRWHRAVSRPVGVLHRLSEGTSNDVLLLLGELWVKRPNLFNWHMTSPDESVLVSDGQTLWFYNPFVEQVTATWLKNATGNTPFMLITRNNASDWKQYNVKQKGDDFELTPKSASGNLKQFAISVTNSGTIRSFAAVEQDGQRSAYTLKSQQNVAADPAKFKFTPPKGVTLDDQRQ